MIGMEQRLWFRVESKTAGSSMTVRKDKPIPKKIKKPVSFIFLKQAFFVWPTFS
jgi:hypothetical protein